MVDALLGDEGSAKLIVSVPEKPRATSRQQSPKRKRQILSRTILTAKERAAWLAYERFSSYSAVGRELGISRQAATKLVKKAHDIENIRSRSIRVTQTLPTGSRGEELV